MLSNSFIAARDGNTTIVTRISSDDNDLADKYQNKWACRGHGFQLQQFCFFGLVPGMPNTLFLTGAFLSGLIAWFTSNVMD